MTAADESVREELRAMRDKLEELRLEVMALRVDSPWLDFEEAAAYLRCPPSRIRKLTSTGDLPVHHEGSRVLYRRNELDAFVAAGGAISP